MDMNERKLFINIFSLIFLMLLSFYSNSCSTTKNIANVDASQENQILKEEVVETLDEEIPEEEVIEEDEQENEESEEKETWEEWVARREKEFLEITENMSAPQKRFYAYKQFYYVYNEVGRDLDYKITIDDDKKEIIIQFKESDSKEDWFNNYLFFPWPLKLDDKVIWTSYGYARIYKSAQNIPFDEFYKEVEEHPDYKVIIWGWSIGSAMAKILARHFIIRTKGQRQIDELTTYGDVKCWYNPFFSLKKHCKKIHEYVTANDLVTWCIPVCRRDVKCVVGPKYSFKESLSSEYYHLHYENYDYSKWENE